MPNMTENVADIDKPNADVFPAAAVEAYLVEKLIEAMTAAAKHQGISVPTSEADQCVMNIEIDSLVVVELLVEVESIIGFELKASIIQLGGYVSVDEAKQHLMPLIQEEWVKKRGKRHA